MAAANLTGLNLQPMPIIRSEMSEAMCILDDIIQGYDGNSVATTEEQEELPASGTTGEINCTTKTVSTSTSADNDQDADKLEFKGCIKSREDHSVESVINNNNESKPKGNVSSHFHSQQDSSAKNGPHHDNRPYRHSRPHAIVTHAAESFHLHPATAASSKRNGRDTDVLPSERPPKRHHHKMQQFCTGNTMTSMADSGHFPFLQQQQPWERFPPSYYYGSYPAQAANSYMMMQQHSTHDGTTGTNAAANYYSDRSFFRPPLPPPQQSRPEMTMLTSPQQQQHQQHDTSTTIPFEDFQYLFYPNQDVVPSSPARQESPSQQPPCFATPAASQFADRPVVSPTSASVSAAFLPPATTDARSVAAAAVQTQETPKQQRSSKKKSRASPSKKQASKVKSIKAAEGPPQKDDEKTDNRTSESFLKPIHHLKWQRQYNNLIQFKRQHGHCLVPIAYEAVPTLPHWVKRQRNQYKKKIAGQETTLTDERQQILDCVGFVWDSHQALWSVRLRECRAFRETHGHCSVPARYAANTMLAVWAKCQRRQFRVHKKGGKCSLTAKRIDELNELDFVWDPLGTCKP